MKTTAIARAVLGATLAACFAVPAFADTASKPSTLKFNSMPMANGDGTADHRVQPYRYEDRVVVIVVDPMSCSQRPVRPRYEVQGDRLKIGYDLEPAKAAGGAGMCAAHSTFEIDGLPHRELSVEFTGGGEPVTVRSMARCPASSPIVDAWDCLVPRK